MDLLNLNNLILPLATGLIAFGGYPQPPQFFRDLASNEWFQWLLVFILIWQGGAGQKWDLALVATTVLFLVTKLLSGSRFGLCPPTTTTTVVV